jgi:hypothetical protein
MRRSEYARHGLYVHFSDCVAQSRLAAEQSSGKERSIAWARLASRFSSELDLVYWAEKVGNADLQESVKRFAAWEKLENYMIIDEIVLPYIMHSKE